MKKIETTNLNRQQGFTLIELSIVLVIIGLIVGGVLVGQDLIKAAQIRATISQVEKYNTSVNTFRVKYNAIPGDMPAASASAFGLFAETTLAGTAGHMDGNGMIEGGTTAATAPVGETLVFWRHLSDASLIDGSFGASGNNLIVVGSGAVTGTVSTANTLNNSIPPAKIGRGLSFIVYSASGFNYYQLTPILTLTATAYTFPATGVGGMTPVEANNIDAKLDDGMPQTGIVLARQVTAVNAAPSAASSTTAATCVIGTTIASDTYNLIPATGGTDPSCALRFRFN